jgi:hypothetical protein
MARDAVQGSRDYVRWNGSHGDTPNKVKKLVRDVEKLDVRDQPKRPIDLQGD